MAIYPLHRAFGVQRVFAASYQAVSGTGARAIAELEQQVALPPKCPADRSLSAPDRLQRAAARRFISRKRLHQRRNENAERRPPHHASPGISRLGHLRARSGVSRAFGGGHRGI